MGPQLQRIEIGDFAYDYHYLTVYHGSRRKLFEGRLQLGEVAQQRFAVAAVEATVGPAPGDRPKPIPFGFVHPPGWLGGCLAHPGLHGPEGRRERRLSHDRAGATSRANRSNPEVS
jgi:hypothetical protein